MNTRTNAPSGGSSRRPLLGLRKKPGRAVLGWGDLSCERVARDFVRPHPFVAFRPCTSVIPENHGDHWPFRTHGDAPAESEKPEAASQPRRTG